MEGNDLRRGVRKKVFSASKTSIPDKIQVDGRFKDVARDPKFRSIPKSESKVAIDKRFGKMFTDKRFKMKTSMDKRGRLLNTTSSEDLKKFYLLEGTSCDDENTDRSKEKLSRKEETTRESAKSRVSSDDELLDFARGEGNVETSDEDSPDSSDGEVEETLQDIEWDELDKDAPRSEDISRRLAVCNLDWQNIKAQDLFVLMSSFAPENGVVESVVIIPSEFGRERMKIESEQGPLINNKSDQALRRNEFDRLRYYYAVVTCNNDETANRIYEVCDGLEYQTSGTKIDLRFIPDDMTFEGETATDECNAIPDSYDPIDFVNSALMLSKCESSWDTDDIRRKRALNRIYSKKHGKTDEADQIGDSLRTYLASESDDEEDGRNRAERYRNILLGGDNENEESDGDKEVTFDPELNAAVEKSRKEKNDSENKGKKTPFQEYIERKKQKKREKRIADREKRRRETAFSDDELPGDEEDEFIRQSLKQDISYENNTEEDDVNQGEERAKQELELLLMDHDRDDERKHFSLKKIMKEERVKAKKMTKTTGDVTGRRKESDQFKVDVHDSRFGSIYTDHRFNIDPTDNSFKKTKAMEAIVQEKAKRRKKFHIS